MSMSETLLTFPTYLFGYSSPEVFTTEFRAKANAIVQVIHYSLSLVITQCSPIALASVGWKYYVSVNSRRNLKLRVN